MWHASHQKDKKGKKNAPTEVIKDTLAELPVSPEAVEEPKLAEEDPWGSWGVAVKKGKKGKVIDPVNVESLVEVRDPAVIFLGIIQPVAIDDSGRVEESLEVLSFDCSHLGDIKAPSASLEAGPEDVDKNSDDPRRGWSGN